MAVCPSGRARWCGARRSVCWRNRSRDRTRDGRGKRDLPGLRTTVSTIARVGMAGWAPGARADNAVATLAWRSASFQPAPSASRVARPPANVSPAPTVSRGCTACVGTDSISLSLQCRVGSLPCVTMAGCEGEELAGAVMASERAAVSRPTASGARRGGRAGPPRRRRRRSRHPWRRASWVRRLRGARARPPGWR